MSARTLFLILVNFMLLDTVLVLTAANKPHEVDPAPPVIQQPQEEPKPEPLNPNISVTIPGWLSYADMVTQLKQWNKEAPDLTEVGRYGETSKGTPLGYIKLGRKDLCSERKKTLIFASIHGNEPWASAIIMGYIGTMLDAYGEDEQVTQLLDSQDIYFVPVASPDSAPQNEYGQGMQRHVEGVDPNRDFPTRKSPDRKSVATVQSLRNFDKAVGGFDAVISGHTWGQVFLKPWGDSSQSCPNDSDYNRILGEMKQLSGYDPIPASQVYGRPIYGTEVDWFYRQGAFSIVIEYGTHQRVPSIQQVKSEIEKTYKAVLCFLSEAPTVEVKKDPAFTTGSFMGYPW